MPPLLGGGGGFADGVNATTIRISNSVPVDSTCNMAAIIVPILSSTNTEDMLSL